MKEAKAREIKAIVDRYKGRDEAGKRDLLDRLNESLADEDLTEEEISKLEADVKMTLDATATPYPRRLRQVARKLYATGHRDAVKDLAQ